MIPAIFRHGVDGDDAGAVTDGPPRGGRGDRHHLRGRCLRRLPRPARPTAGRRRLGSIVPALYVYVGLYAVMLAVTWVFYLRRGASDGRGSDRVRCPVDRHPLPLLRAPVRDAAARASRTSGTGQVAPRDFPTNRGGLCQKGWTSAEVLTRPDRLTTPLVRRGRRGSSRRRGTRRSTSWPRRLARCSDAHGPDAVAVFGGGGLTNEKAYQLGKFARVVLGTPPHRLQRPVLHVVGRGRPATAPSASTGGSRSRSTDLGERGGRAAARQQPRRHHAALRPAPRRGARPRRPGRGRPPAARRPRR